MLVFAYTFKFKAPHMLMFRRLHNVAKVVRDESKMCWCVTKENGVYLEVPMDAVVMLGRKLTISEK